MQSALKAVILVGGEGTRLRPLTYDTPKSMVPVLNRPFFEHTLAHLKKYHIKEIVLAVNYHPELIRDYFGDGDNFGIKLIYSVEHTPLGTAGAVKNAERYLDGTFSVLNGDIFYDLDMAAMLAFHRARGAKATIALTWVDNPCAYGLIETDDNKKVKRFIEKPSPDRVTTNWINAGTYILEPEVLKHVPANSFYMFEKGLFPLLLELGEPVYGYPSSGYWLDMGTPENYLKLNYDLLLSKARCNLFDSLNQDTILLGEKCEVHPEARISAPAIIGSNVKISKGVVLKGPVVIGPDCHLGEDTVVEKAVLWKGVSIGTGAVLKQCIIGSYTTIGNNAEVINCAMVGDHINIASHERSKRLTGIPKVD